MREKIRQNGHEVGEVLETRTFFGTKYAPYVYPGGDVRKARYVGDSIGSDTPEDAREVVLTHVNRTRWVSDGRVVDAGDAFGDAQAGPVWALTYTRADRPNERVSVHFGVIFNEAKRYSGHIEILREDREHGDWDLVSGETPEPQHGAFYCDHDTFAPAKRDVDQEISRWSVMAFTDNDLGIE